METKKWLVGMFVFGSLWGFAECVIGSLLRDVNLPAGAIMTGVFAFGLMAMSRIIYQKRGMQLGMGLVAGAMRLFNPFGGCFMCSAIAIMAEGLLFEIIWYRVSLTDDGIKSLPNKISLGIVTSYGVYVIGYMVTQVLTPVFSSAGFFLPNLLGFIPQILASGLLAAVIGGFMAPVVFHLREVDTVILRNKAYYPLTLGISAVCWIIVLVNSPYLSV